MKSNFDCAGLLKRIEFVLCRSKIGVDIIDSGFNIRYIDPGWAKVYGNPAGKKCYRYFMRRSSPCSGCGVTKALRTKKMTVSEEVLKYEGNKPIKVTTIPFKDKSGKWMVAETNVDISDLKGKELALNASLDQLRSIGDNLVGGMIYQIIRMKDGARKFTYLSGNVKNLYGVTTREAMENPDLIYGRVHSEDRRRLRLGEEAAYRAMRTFSAEARIVGPDGKIRWAYFISRPKKIAGGATLWDGIEFDITDRKTSEGALLESNSALESIIESAFTGIMVVDLYGRITRFNKKFVEIWKIPKAVMDSRSDRLAIESATKQLRYPEKFVAGVERLYRNPRQSSYDLIEFKDGRFFERHSRPQIIGSEVVGRVWTFHDITSIKEAERVLKRDKKSLRKLVNSKSAELINAREELYRARRLSEIGTLSATIAHELRTPLAAIRTAAYNIRSKSKDSRLSSHVENIEKKVMDSDRIIRNLLLYCSMKNPQPEEVVIYDLLKECVGITRDVYHDRISSIRVVRRCRRGLSIEADPTQLSEVFHNLLNNACEASGAGKARIIVSIHSANDMVNVTIKDNGVGIDPEDLKRMFEPFFSTKQKGTGLGLPVCREIVNLYNGEIRIKSKKGKGTEITVSLPIRFHARGLIADVEKSQKKVEQDHLQRS